MSPILRRITQLLALVFLQGVLLFAGAGTLGWRAAWWYIGLYLAMLVLASLVFLPGHAEVVSERSRGAQDGKGWDVLITRLMILPALGLLLAAGLDERLGWSAPLPVWARALGGLGLVIGYAIVLWAMSANPYFSQVVRIQSERGHVALSDGPYRIVRHPGYLGMIISYLGSLLLLDAPWAGLACFALYLSLVLIRTTLEDRTLQAELPGYADYAQRTRFRLVPGLW